ncbi:MULTISPECIES: hypothetical protein [Pseudoalteromonas]|uniref:Uncharacterized protein n=1 Tax=Pseudoalteromonas rubra TaxID=43658 RepID=A0A8T0CA24_9GAMM|nr:MULTISPECIES: hypothetical protein [Pseudoalteromonas]KAF7787533.1 hypothetical protein PRUB_a4638 [Pseudoalteromonas rubra]KAF7787536.1 hypothetical protein PRUB_a4641 [Pseudoalteromonas rubra]KAF7787540.1 hypothetical protein PRUB_a4646 [Pseudoalteromonas rubra]MCG7563963.1 hypothetical protein [Pseudoalteromonas sp. McH1-42]MEC4091357.1 hypothetical protein [Pseudoalteromonas rubra]
MLNSAAACSNTQTTLNTVEAPVIKRRFKLTAWLNNMGKQLMLSQVVMYK